VKTGDQVSIYLRNARPQAANAIVENVTASGFSILLKLLNKPAWVLSLPNVSTGNIEMLLSRTETGPWIEVSTGYRYEIEEQPEAGVG
jgi:hypothetical protein